MPAVNGSVDVVSIKEMNEADRFGNTHRASLKIVGEDKWYSYGTIKKPEINIKTNGNWNQLQKGMEVEFMYDQNGDFSNIKKQSFSITNAEGGVPSAPAPQQQAQQPKQSTQGKSFVNPAEVGQCLNLAADVLQLGEEDLLDPVKVKGAIQWYKEVRELFSTLYPTVEITTEAVKEAVKAPTKAKPKAKTFDEAMMEDDI